MHALPHVPPVARVLFVVTLCVWVVAEVRQAANHRPEATTADRGSRPFVRVATVLGVVAAVLLAHAVPAAAFDDPAVAAWVGLGLLVGGVGLRLWCFRTLGRYFTFTVQTSADQPVITAGPYRVVRHPSYAAVLLAVCGLGLLIGNWCSLVVLVAGVACGIVVRIRVEERALLAELGDPYRAYAAGRKRLVPFVW